MADEKVDYADVAGLAASIGGKDVGKVIRVYTEHKSEIDAVVAFLKKLFHKDKPAPVPQVVLPPTAPPVVVEPPARPIYRTIDSLSLKLFFVETNGNVSKLGRKKAIEDGSEPVNFGERVHFDITPSAKGEEVGPGSAALSQLDGPDGKPLLQHIVSIDGGDQAFMELHSYDDDHGCTPVLKAPDDANDGHEHTVEYFVRLGAVESNHFTYRLKGARGPA